VTNSITVNRDELIRHLQLSCQIPAAIASIAARQIIASAATEAGIKVGLEELQQTADNLRLVNKLLHADDTWAWLQKHHLSLDEFEAIAYTNAISAKLAQHLFADKVEPFFIEHQLDFAGAAIYEIVLDDRDLALELFYALQEGEISFHEVARQYIQDRDLRRAGGYRGIVRRPELRPEISAAVFAAIPPQILKPIVTPKGAHLILVEEIVQPQLDEQLRLKILSDLFSEWIDRQIEQVEIITELESDLLAAKPHAHATSRLASERVR